MPSLTEKSGRMAKGLAFSFWLGATALAGGCAGFDGVELQGGVFDALGVSSSTQSKRLADVKVDARPGLVLPPTTERLPEPVTGSIAVAPQDGSWPIDPEDRRAEARAALDKRHQEFCERALQNARVTGDSGPVMGPKGNCQPGILGSLTNQLSGR